jgi:intracellular protein transport protein USO1
LQDPAPQEFALQFWDEQKHANATLVIDIMGMLLGSKGNPVCSFYLANHRNHADIRKKTKESLAYTRCFIEISLASNAPTALKAHVSGYSRILFAFSLIRRFNRLFAYYPPI